MPSCDKWRQILTPHANKLIGYECTTFTLLTFFFFFKSYVLFRVVLTIWIFIELSLDWHRARSFICFFSISPWLLVEFVLVYQRDICFGHRHKILSIIQHNHQGDFTSLHQSNGARAVTWLESLNYVQHAWQKQSGGKQQRATCSQKTQSDLGFTFNRMFTM